MTSARMIRSASACHPDGSYARSSRRGSTFRIVAPATRRDLLFFAASFFVALARGCPFGPLESCGEPADVLLARFFFAPPFFAAVFFAPPAFFLDEDFFFAAMSSRLRTSAV